MPVKSVDGLRGGEVRRYGAQVLVHEIPDEELTPADEFPERIAEIRKQMGARK